MKVNLAFVPLLMLGSFLEIGAATISFDYLPDSYLFGSGDENIGTFYSGLDFESNVTALSATRFGGYDNTAFPPHSGDMVVWDASEDTITISFTSPQDDVGVWYTSLNPITLTAFNSSSLPLGLAAGDANSDGTTGTSDFLSISANDISTVDISSVAGQYVLDDLQFSNSPTATATPEPSSGSAIVIGLLLMFFAAGLLSLMTPKSYFGPKSLNRTQPDERHSST